MVRAPKNALACGGQGGYGAGAYLTIDIRPRGDAIALGFFISWQTSPQAVCNSGKKPFIANACVTAGLRM
jgi:hypothetical protein